MKSKIFGIGLSRTGTTSLNNLLRSIGYNVIHYPLPIVMNDFNNDGGTDITVANRYKELDAMWPNSKFILTTRDRTQWLNSVVPYFERKRDWESTGKQVSWQVKERVAMYGSTIPNRYEAASAWDRHMHDVNQFFKRRSQDLLVVDMFAGDTPEALYNFLGKDPTGLPTKYPHDNKLNEKR